VSVAPEAWGQSESELQGVRHNRFALQTVTQRGPFAVYGLSVAGHSESLWHIS
jgi:hypothetical protein